MLSAENKPIYSKKVELELNPFYQNITISEHFEDYKDFDLTNLKSQFESIDPDVNIEEHEFLNTPLNQSKFNNPYYIQRKSDIFHFLSINACKNVLKSYDFSNPTIDDIEDGVIIAGGANGKIITSTLQTDEANVVFNNLEEIHAYIFAAISQIEQFMDNKTSFLVYYELNNSFIQMTNMIFENKSFEQKEIDLIPKYLNIIIEIEQNAKNGNINSNTDINNAVFKRFLYEVRLSKMTLYTFLDFYDLLEEDSKFLTNDLSQTNPVLNNYENRTEGNMINHKHAKTLTTKQIPQAYTQSDNFYSPNLRNAYKSLLDKLIHADTTFDNFESIFNNQKPSTPIVWIGGIESLCYFIKQIHLERKLIKSIPKKIWDVSLNLFVDESGNNFIKSSLKSQHIPTNQNTTTLIDKAIDCFDKVIMVRRKPIL